MSKFKAKFNLQSKKMNAVFRIETTPQKLSELKNDTKYITEDELAGKGYLTEHQDLTAYAKSADVDSALNKKQDVIGDIDTIRTNANLVTTKQDAISDLDTIRANAEKGANALQSVPDEYVTDKELSAKGYLTEHQDLTGYAKTTDIPDISGKADKADIPTNLSQLTDDLGENPKHTHSQYLTEHQDLTAYAKSADVDSALNKKQDVIKDIDTIRTNANLVTTKQDAISDLDTIRANAEKGANALQSVPDEYVTDEELSAKGYLTEHQDLTGYAKTTDIPDISGKADKADVYSKAEVDAKVASVYRYRGSVDSFDKLPATDLAIGDTYNVNDTGANYAWTGEIWDKLSETIDLTPYALKTDIPDVSDKANKADLATVATTGSYNDLSDKPNIPEGATVDRELSTTSANAVANNTITKALNKKQDVIKDIDTIRTNANLVTTKQDAISDLDTIRANAEKGANALQSVPDEYVTDEELSAKGYLTEHQDLTGYAKTTDIPDVSGKADKADIPTNLSQLTDDLGENPKHTHSQYLTEHQDLTAYAKTADIDLPLGTGFWSEDKPFSDNWVKVDGKTALSGDDYPEMWKLLTSILNGEKKSEDIDIIKASEVSTLISNTEDWKNIAGKQAIAFSYVIDSEKKTFIPPRCILRSRCIGEPEHIVLTGSTDYNGEYSVSNYGGYKETSFLLRLEKATKTVGDKTYTYYKPTQWNNAEDVIDTVYDEEEKCVKLSANLVATLKKEQINDKYYVLVGKALPDTQQDTEGTTKYHIDEHYVFVTTKNEKDGFSLNLKLYDEEHKYSSFDCYKIMDDTETSAYLYYQVCGYVIPPEVTEYTTNRRLYVKVK